MYSGVKNYKNNSWNTSTSPECTATLATKKMTTPSQQSSEKPILQKNAPEYENIPGPGLSPPAPSLIGSTHLSWHWPHKSVQNPTTNANPALHYLRLRSS